MDSGKTSLPAEVHRRALGRKALTAFVTGGDADSIIADLCTALYEESSGWGRAGRQRLRKALRIHAR